MSTRPEAAYPGELRVYGDAAQLAGAAADLFVQVASESIRARGRFRVALSGGSTPRRVYGLLATPAYSRRIDWERTDIFLGDERYVAADDRASNYRMVAEALLQHVPAASANLRRVPTEISPPAAAADAYADEIRQCFGDSAKPRFDLIFLGVGTNGHMASLFPHSPALKESSRLVLADYVSELGSWRITMSVPLLNQGRNVAFLVEGPEKAQVLREVLRGRREPDRLPAQLIAPEGKLLWLVDQSAAAGVRGEGRERLECVD